MNTKNWSKQQQAIFEWFKTSTVSGQHVQHLIVRARAGTGKSTTIRQGVKYADEKIILICAFSKDIQVAMQQAIGQFAGEVKTLHAVGFACVNRFRTGIKVSFKGDRAEALALKVCGMQAPSAILKLVANLCTKGREIAPHASKLGDLTALAYTFECEPAAEYADMGFDLTYVETKALAAMELAAQVKDGDTIDGSDMIFLPVRNGWLTKKYDLVVVDEAQDMTTAQLEIAQGVLKVGGRICIVGDNRQAIFAFRGADAESLDRLKAELTAGELGLTVTYRCGKAIVALALRLVPDFEAAEGNSEGIIDSISLDKLVEQACAGCYILSRVNAPLVSIAMKLLRAGKRTKVAGREIGKGLVTLIRKFKAASVPQLLARIEGWQNREVARLTTQLNAATNGRKKAIEAKIEAIYDQGSMLISLTDGAKNVDEVTTRIEALFTDDGLGQAGMITCSSVHRAKGQEADRVFILADTLRENNQEEMNITYVAITRAKQQLTWVR